jgi:hypothetical protein
MPENLRIKVSGLNHWNSLYPESALERAFELLATTNYVAKVIGELTDIDTSTIQHIVKGGHSWLHAKYPEMWQKIQCRAPKKLNTGFVNSNENILLVMQTLLDSPTLDFSEISSLTGVSKETVSAVSSGRQFSELILNSHLNERAKKYFELGRSSYKKSHSSMSLDIEEKFTNIMLDVIVTNKWKSRDILNKIWKLDMTLARKLTELDSNLLDSYISLNYAVNLPTVIKFINVRKNSKRVTQHTLDMLDKYKSNDRPSV